MINWLFHATSKSSRTRRRTLDPSPKISCNASSGRTDALAAEADGQPIAGTFDASADLNVIHDGLLDARESPTCVERVAPNQIENGRTGREYLCLRPRRQEERGHHEEKKVRRRHQDGLEHARCLEPRVENPHRRSLAGGVRHPAAQQLRAVNGVRINHENPVACRLVQPDLQRIRLPEPAGRRILTLHHLQVGEFLPKLSENLRGGVGRAVVHHHHLEVRIVLAAEGTDGLADSALFVAGRHDDGDKRPSLRFGELAARDVGHQHKVDQTLQREQRPHRGSTSAPSHPHWKPGRDDR